MAYLYQNQNAYAPVRSNGRKFWGHPQRGGSIRYIVLHTAESLPRYSIPDPGAEAVARFQSTTSRPSSYHRIGDSDSTVVCLPDEAVAFGAVNANTHGWQWSWATQAWRWPGKPKWWKDQALERGASECARVAVENKIPLRRLSRGQWLRGELGFVYHGDVDPGRRTDPGIDTFPWDKFAQMLAYHMGGKTDPEKETRMDVTQFGDEGGHVVWWKNRLNQWQEKWGKGGGDPLDTKNPRFDEAMRGRIKAMQQHHFGFPHTGVLDNDTIARIIHDLHR